MTWELQELVDGLAEHFAAPAVLADREQRTLVHSVQHGQIDELRRQSILHRRAHPNIVAELRQGVGFRSTEPIRVAPNPRAGILGRLCLPVRHRGRPLGFLWLIDDRARIDADALARAAPALRRLALLMYDEDMARTLAGRLLGRLLSPWPELRAAGVRDILAEGLVPDHTPVAVLVTQPLHCPAATAREVVGQLLWDLAHETGCGGTDMLRLTRADHGVLLVRVPSLDDEETVLGTAARVHRALHRTLTEVAGDTAGGTPPRAVVGVGEPQPDLAGALVSYRQARLASHVATLVPSVGDVPTWRRLGAFRILAMLPPDLVAEQALDPRLLELFRTCGRDVVETLETYLDLGCDAKATSERLYLHRATLYYRLAKVERLIGIDLHDGNDRLAIHLSLKLSHLAGLHPDRS